VSDPRPQPRVNRKADQGSSGPGASNRYLATGAVSEGDFGLFESELGPGANGPGPHYHQHFSESFYLLGGRLAISTETGLIVAESGDFVYVPRDAVHGFKNASDHEVAYFLILFSPGIARELYFEGLIELRERGASIEEIDEFARFHDQVNLRDR
jgi:quercetin dioxygenase-like cupin family protein